MSTNEEADSETTDSTNDATADAGPGTREVAYRLFATEFEDSELSYSESDEERAPNYVVTPTGLRLNRLFAVGVLTEVERINTDTLRGRIVDPTGAFVTYAGQYQPEAQAFLDGADSPSFVAITGKARTFEPEDSDRIFTSVRPESLSEVDADTRDRWTVSAAEATLERVAVVGAALDSDLRGEELRVALETAGVDTPLAAGIPRALDYYGTTTAYLEAIRQCAVDALEVVAGEREEVRPVDVAPDEGGTATLGPLPEVGIDLSGTAIEAAPTSEEPEPETATAEASTPAADSASESAEPSDPTATQPTESPDPTATTDAETDTAEADAPESTVSATESNEPTTEPTTSTATETAAESTTTAESDDSSTTDTATESTTAEPSTTAETESSTEPDTTSSSAADTDTATSESSEPAATDDVDESADDAEMYQLDDEEREELESEFGADFSSGNEVDPAGEADIDVPDADELAAEVEDDSEPSDGGVESTNDAAEPATSEPTETTESDDSTESLGSFEDTIDDTDESSAETDAEPAETTSESTASTDAASDDAAASGDGDADAVDLEDTAVELMADLDDGDGADREAVVDAVVDAHGAERAAVEDAIDDALMGGRCYEPDDGTLKPI
ncbi:hypothetical protein [Halonotius roseus]|uniref:Rpa-associated protein n=1 Tax=Halonotius roseus TaxID=2511997 RepID=A0A544QPQ8_9EURY|nr:hypothetical protein [Halonotius roseus]TQQ81427.1 hypothetical protein EWF95_00315 [Halonotius roseus]